MGCAVQQGQFAMRAAEVGKGSSGQILPSAATVGCPSPSTMLALLSKVVPVAGA